MSLPKQQHLRLPRGMHDRTHDWVMDKIDILLKHSQICENSDFELIELSPISYSSTFGKVGTLNEEKVYSFEDKSGRPLVLSCDSQSSLFRHYVNKHLNDNEPASFAFIAPIFRYRHIKNRHFTQIGYMSINVSGSYKDEQDVLEDMTQSILSLANARQVRVEVILSDMDLIAKMLLNSKCAVNNMNEFVHALMFPGEQSLEDVVREYIPEFKQKDSLLRILRSGPMTIEEAKEFLVLLNLSACGKTLFSCAENFRNMLDCSVYIDFSNFADFRNKVAISVRFRTEDGKHIGDGGHYHTFGNSFHENIKSVTSVATGIETLIRNKEIK